MSSRDKIKKIIAWCIAYWVLFAIVGLIATGGFLRFYQIGNVYSDGDDAGLLNSYKRDYPPQTIINLASRSFFTLKVVYDTVGLSNNLLDSPLYPVWVGRSWTYPIGQYALYPLLIREHYSNYTKFVLGRSISAVFSSFSLVLFAYLLYLINDRKKDVAMLIPLALMVFSFNSVLYAHHMSPYSAVVTTTIIALVLFLRTLEKQLKVEWFYACLGILTIFNYLVLLMVPLFSILFIFYFKLYEIKKAIKFFYKGVALYLIIFSPVLVLFFRPNSGHGNLPVIESGMFAKIPFYLAYFPKQFISVLASAVAGFTRVEFFNEVIVVGVLASGFFILAKKYRTMNKSALYALIFSVLFWGEWLVLHGLDKIVMDRSRHVLLWLPLFCLFFFLVISSFKFKYKQTVNFIILILICIFGVRENVLIINSKLINLDLSAIEKASTSNTILLFGNCAVPRNYFWGAKHVYSLNYEPFDFSEIDLPAEMVLVSDSHSWKDYLASIKPEDPQYTKDHIAMILRLYNVQAVKEQPSATYFSYDNSPVSSNQNGFFMYKLTRKNKV